MRLIIVTGLAVAAVGAFATVRIWQQGDRDEQRPVDAIVVLGAAQYDGRPSPVFEARLDHAVKLWHEGIAKAFVVTGGKLPGDRTTEAAVARAYAMDHAVPGAAIFGENEAHNTLESMRSVAAEMKQRGMTSAVFVSDPTHMLRVLRIARDLGIDAYGSPTPTSPVQHDLGRRIGATIHELGALAVYFVSGGTPAVEQPRQLIRRGGATPPARSCARVFSPTQICARKRASTPWNTKDPRLYSGPVLRHPGIGAARATAPAHIWRCIPTRHARSTAEDESEGTREPGRGSPVRRPDRM